jgi:hypothetical protein
VPWHLLRTPLPRPAHEVNASLSRAERIDDVLRIHDDHAAHFDQIHVGTFWRSVGRIARTDESQRAWIYDNENGAFAAGRATTVRMACLLEPPSIATSAGGIWRAGLGYSPAWDEAWRRLEGAALARLDDFNEVQLSFLARAHAALPERLPHARRRILDATALRMSAGGRPGGRAASLAGGRPEARLPQPALDFLSLDRMVSLARAFASAQHEAPDLLRLIILRATRSADRLPLPQLTGLLQAVTRLGMGQEAVGLFGEAVRAVDQLDDSSLAGLVWSLAHAQLGDPGLYRRVARLATRDGRLQNFRPLDLAVLAHAFSSASALGADETPPDYVLDLFDQLADQAAVQVGLMGPYELTSIARAFAQAQAAGRARPADELLRAVGAAAVPQLHAFNGQELATLAHAMASVSMLGDGLLRNLADEIGPRLDELKPRELVALTVAIRQSGMHARLRGFLSDLGSHLHERQAELTDAERIVVASAFTRMRLPEPVDVLGAASSQF